MVESGGPEVEGVEILEVEPPEAQEPEVREPQYLNKEEVETLLKQQAEAMDVRLRQEQSAREKQRKEWSQRVKRNEDLYEREKARREAIEAKVYGDLSPEERKVIELQAQIDELKFREPQESVHPRDTFGFLAEQEGIEVMHPDIDWALDATDFATALQRITASIKEVKGAQEKPELKPAPPKEVPPVVKGPSGTTKKKLTVSDVQAMKTSEINPRELIEKMLRGEIATE